jgi:hypothetical protein
MVVGVACRITTGAVGNAEHDLAARYPTAQAAGDFEIAASNCRGARSTSSQILRRQNAW